MIGGLWRKVVAAGLLCLAAACTTVQTTEPGAVGIDRKQRMLVSNEDVAAGAEQAYAQELQKARETGKLNTDSALTARVRHVSERLIPVTAVFRRDAPSWKWEINTLKTDDLNAYAMPGGKIMVYSGLVEHAPVVLEQNRRAAGPHDEGYPAVRGGSEGWNNLTAHSSGMRPRAICIATA